MQPATRSLTAAAALLAALAGPVHAGSEAPGSASGSGFVRVEAPFAVVATDGAWSNVPAMALRWDFVPNPLYALALANPGLAASTILTPAYDPFASHPLDATATTLRLAGFTSPLAMSPLAMSPFAPSPFASSPYGALFAGARGDHSVAAALRRISDCPLPRSGNQTPTARAAGPGTTRAPRPPGARRPAAAPRVDADARRQAIGRKWGVEAPARGAKP